MKRRGIVSKCVYLAIVLLLLTASSIESSTSPIGHGGRSGVGSLWEDEERIGRRCMRHRRGIGSISSCSSGGGIGSTQP